MRGLRVLRHRLQSVFRRSRSESQLDVEIEIHLEQLVRELTASGMTTGEARREALRQFGSTALTREQCRDMRRSTVEIAQLAFLFAGWTLFPGSLWRWTGLAIGAVSAPWIVALLLAAIRPPFDKSWRAYYGAVGRDALTSAQQVALVLSFLPHQAWVSADAILRTLWRLLISRQGLPEFPAWPIDNSVDRLLQFHARCSLIASGATEAEFLWFWPESHSAALILTHDVEGAEGIRLALSLADLEEELGFPLLDVPPDVYNFQSNNSGALFFVNKKLEVLYPNSDDACFEILDSLTEFTKKNIRQTLEGATWFGAYSDLKGSLLD